MKMAGLTWAPSTCRQRGFGLYDICVNPTGWFFFVYCNTIYTKEPPKQQNWSFFRPLGIPPEHGLDHHGMLFVPARKTIKLLFVRVFLMGVLYSIKLSKVLPGFQKCITYNDLGNFLHK